MRLSTVFVQCRHGNDGFGIRACLKNAYMYGVMLRPWIGFPAQTQ